MTRLQRLRESLRACWRYVLLLTRAASAQPPQYTVVQLTVGNTTQFGGI